MKDSLNGWRASPLLAMLSIMMLLPVASESSWAAGSAAWQEDSTTEARRDWGFFTEIALPSDAGPPWFDFVLGPSVFDKARLDLGDLRL